jgi:PII-like signaling protein
VYFGRRDNVRGVPAFEVICELLYRREIGGATAFLGVDGTAHGRRQQARSFSRNADLPVMVVAGGSGDRIGMMLPELAGLRICKRYGHLTNVPKLAAGVDDRGFPLWRKLTVYTSEAGRHEGQPVDRAIVRRLRSAGVSGATTHRGFWGFHGDRPPHGDRLLNLECHAPRSRP